MDPLPSLILATWALCLSLPRQDQLGLGDFYPARPGTLRSADGDSDAAAEQGEEDSEDTGLLYSCESRFCPTRSKHATCRVSGLVTHSEIRSASTRLLCDCDFHVLEF